MHFSYSFWPEGTGKGAFEYSFVEWEKRSGVKVGFNPTDTANSGGQTDGMGEKQPVGDSNTPEGKANNRKVDFIKT